MERLRYAHTWRPAIQNLTRLPFEASLKAMVRFSSSLKLHKLISIPDFGDGQPLICSLADGYLQ